MAGTSFENQDASVAQLQKEVAALRAELASLRKDHKQPTHLYDHVHHEDSTYSSESGPSGATLSTVLGTSPGSPLGLNPEPDQSEENREDTPTSAHLTPDDDANETSGPDDNSGDFSSVPACEQDQLRQSVGVQFPAARTKERSTLAVRLHAAKNTIRNMIRSYFQPPVPPGYERITWKCVCTGYSRETIQSNRFE